MAFCKNCGKELKEGATFCTNCGTSASGKTEQNQSTHIRGLMPEHDPNEKEPVDVFAEKLGQGASVTVNKTKEISSELGEKMKTYGGSFFERVKADKKLQTILAGVVGVLVVVLIVVGIVSTNAKKIDLAEYVEISCSGYNGNGSVNVNIKEEELLITILEQKGYDEDSITSMLSGDYLFGGFSSKVKDLERLQKEIETIEKVYQTVSFTPDKTEELSNGDQITVTIDFDEKLAKKSKISFKGNEYTYVVEGLGDYIELDPFEHLQVQFTGIAPNTNIEYSYDGNDGYLNSWSFTTDKNGGFDAGDKVKISVNVDEEYLKRNGYVLTRTENEYTCENVGYYVTSLDQITEEMEESIKKDCCDVVESYFAGYFETLHYEDLQYLGSYFLLPKDNENSSNARLYMIYSLKISTTETKSHYDYDLRRNVEEINFPTQTIYFPIRIERMSVTSEGSIEYYVDESSIEGDSGLNVGWSSIPGYVDGNMMYNQIVIVNKTNYIPSVKGEVESFETEEISVDVDYVLEDSNSRYIDESELENLTAQELKIARNEIYARYGRIFDSEDLKAHFESKSWYQPSILPEDFKEDMLNEYEMANRDLIQEYEEKMGYR